MSTCTMHDRIAAFASGDDDPALTAHLPGCPACRAELAADRALIAALRRNAPRPGDGPPLRDLSAAFLVDAPPEGPRRRRRGAWLAASIAGAGALVLAAVLWFGRAPLPGAALSVDVPRAVVTAPAKPTATAPATHGSGDELAAVLTDDDSPEPSDLDDPFAALETLDDQTLDAVLASL